MPVLVDGELVLYGFCGDDLFGDGFSDRDVLDALAELGREADVIVRLNSPGGYTDPGKAIFNALKAHAGHVTIAVDGIAASIASVIAMAGDEIIMRTGSLMMIHEASGMTFGDAEEHRRGAEWLERESMAMASIYTEKTGTSTDDIREMMKAETWMTADEAVEAGLADRTDGTSARAVAAFDYRSYPKAPKALKAKARKSNWSLEEARKAAACAADKPRQHEVISMTDKPAAGNAAVVNEPVDPPAIESAADIHAAKAEGRTEALAYVAEVNDLCSLSGQPDRARGFIEAGASVADIRKTLLEDRASADAGSTIETQIPAGASGALQKGALAARMQRLVGKEA